MKPTTRAKKTAKIAKLQSSFASHSSEDDEEDVTLDMSQWASINGKSSAFKRLKIKLGNNWEVRVEEFYGKPRISLREWTRDDSGEEKTIRGANLDIKFLPKIIAAMNAAAEHVKKFNLVG